jgi:hypothetical protein
MAVVGNSPHVCGKPVAPLEHRHGESAIDATMRAPLTPS